MGYDVSCSLRNTFTVLGFYFYIVSSSHSVDKMQSAMWLFALSIPDMISSLNEDAYMEHVSVLRAKLLSPPNSLQESADERWRSLEDTNAQCVHISHEVARELLTIAKSQVVSFCRDFFCASKVLIVQCDKSTSYTPLKCDGVPVECNIWPATYKRANVFI